MKCPTKKIFSANARRLLELTDRRMNELGLPIDPLTGAITFHPAKEFKATRGSRAIAGPINPETGLIRQPYLDVMALHREYHKASSALSRHLSTHRC